MVRGRRDGKECRCRSDIGVIVRRRLRSAVAGLDRISNLWREMKYLDAMLMLGSQLLKFGTLFFRRLCTTSVQKEQRAQATAYLEQTLSLTLVLACMLKRSLERSDDDVAENVPSGDPRPSSLSL